MAMDRWMATKAYSVFRHRDFRLLWFGAFFSFMGGWAQQIAQGYLVYLLTESNAKLAIVTVCAMLPVTFFGLLAGVVTDSFDKRRLLVAAQMVFAATALYLAAATYWGFVTYEQILVIALINGTVSAVEMPTRQSVVSKVVPPEDLPAAIPFNAMTFNFARIIGPAIGGVLLGLFGPAACYLMNGLSFSALIFAGLAIRTDLRATPREKQPILDLIMEGLLYTMRDVRLKTLFFLESAVSIFGLFYLSQMAAIAEQMLSLGKRLGNAYLAVGIGSITALFVVMTLSDRPVKAFLIRLATTVMGVALILLAFTTNEWVAYVYFAVLGFCAVTIFNLCNTLFQTLSPEHLRGRVLSMHIWALSGIGPVGVFAFGLVAEEFGLPVALGIGGGVMVVAGAIAWMYKKGFAGSG